MHKFNKGMWLVCIFNSFMCKELKSQIKNEGIVTDLIKSSKKNNVFEMNTLTRSFTHSSEPAVRAAIRGVYTLFVTLLH